MLQRAFSILDIKSADVVGRTFSGIATSPEPDRVGDVIDPSGVKFKNPLALLLYHDSKKPVGETRFGRATKDGIPFDAIISTIDRPGVVKDRLDEAMDSLHANPPLIKAVSIGFRPLEDPVYLKETGGFRYPSIEVMELSMVVIPAQAEATIHTVKSICSQELAALGTEPEAASHRKTSAGASASTRVVHMDDRRNIKMPKPISEQIRGFEATRQAKAAERDAIMEKSAEEGVTLDAEQTEKYDALDVDIKAIDEHLKRLRALEESNKQAAKQVDGTSQKAASESRGAAPVITVKETTPPDLLFARMVLCKAASFLECSRGNFISPLQIAQKRYPSSESIHNYLVAKTAVAGGTTTDSNFAAALLAPAQVLESAFLEYLRPRTIVGKFGTNGIPSLRRVPFNVKIQSQSTGASASWVGEGKAKPVTKFNTTSTTLLFTKVAAIAVITDELARFSVPGAETVVRDELSKAVIERLDRDFIDPDIAVSSGVNPASITNGLVGKTTVGTSAANVLTDIQNLVAPFLLANYDVSDLVLIMPNSLALVLSLMQNSLGQDSFKGMTVAGGTLAGLPVITSQYAAMGSSYGNMVICVSASNIALADDGTVTVDASREASIQMDGAPGRHRWHRIDVGIDVPDELDRAARRAGDQLEEVADGCRHVHG